MATRRGKGDGSITQRHDHPTCPPAIDGERAAHRCQGRWVGVLNLGWSGGKRQRKTMYGRTRKEVVVKLDTVKRERDTSAIVIASPTMEAWLRYWLDVICAERGLKVNTMKSHRSKVERYLIPNLGRHRVDRLAPEHVRAMYVAMRAQGLSEATLRQTHAILHRALKVAAREGKTSRNVAELIDPPKVEKNKRIGLTVADARRVLKVSGLRWHLALYMGLRQGEALGLRWEDVHVEESWLSVEQTVVREPGAGLVFDTPKSAASRRMVPIPPVVQAWFKLARIEAGGDPTGLVFHDGNGGPVDNRRDWEEWRAVLNLASTPPWAPVPQVALHAARNTTARLLEEAGIPARMVAQILGQSTVEVTYGYQGSDLGRMTEAMLALEAYVGDD